MSTAITWATAARVLRQVRHDPRTIAMLLVLPSGLLALLRYMFHSTAEFDRFAPALLAIFPFVVMFVVTSVGTLRERSSGTLERLLTMPIGKLDLLLGYAIAFGAFAVLQVVIAVTIAVTLLGMTVAGSLPLLVVIAVVDALLGMALGLLASAFARTEFQAVQFMPLVAIPQILVCGLFVPRDGMTTVLRWLSDVLPLTYAVDAIQRVGSSAGFTGVLGRDIAIVAGSALLALICGAATLRRAGR